ncbi:MAG TPA: shikimate kinase [Gemmatimonadales bacterium]|nr:shikimate kinase [Gemmatimonadales bacterium]
MKRHLILVGLPGSGKSTVGALAAAELGAGFTDLDEAIEAMAGVSITEIFATRGEAAFRELEREAMDAALLGNPQVIAPGGGWAAQPGNLAAVEDRAVVVYLAISPKAAARRLEGDTARPLLAGAAQPRERLEQLLLAREPFYRLAALEVDAESGPPEFVAKAVAAAARQHGI